MAWGGPEVGNSMGPGVPSQVLGVKSTQVWVWVRNWTPTHLPAPRSTPMHLFLLRIHNFYLKVHDSNLNTIIEMVGSHLHEGDGGDWVVELLSTCSGGRVSSGVGMWWGCCHYLLLSVMEVMVVVVLEWLGHWCWWLWCDQSISIQVPRVCDYLT